MSDYYVYIMASQKRGTLYTGVTNDLVRRVAEHKEGLGSTFTSRYGVVKLVYFEDTPSVQAALAREKQLKKWSRQWKIELIERDNPDWEDLYYLVT